MDFINGILNLLAPIISLAALIFFLPHYLHFSSLRRTYRSVFAENLAGKVVVIAGASSGIGEHLAYEYGKKGAFLVIGARREDALRQVAERAVSLGSPRTIPLRIDVSRYEECRRLIEEADSQFGRLNHLVISAGVTPVSLFEDTFDVDNFSLAMDTNFWGVAYTIYFAAPYLRTTRGKIVAISSSTSWLNAPRLSFYNASKAAVVSFMETLRVEFGSEIGITLVTPGLIESEVTKGKFLDMDGKMVVDQDMRDVVLSAVPIEKVERCAKAVVASACRGDKYLTWPPWMSSTLLVKSLCPEVLDWFNRWYLLTEPGVLPTEAISKKVADLPGLKDIVWPDSVQSPKIKTS